VTMTWATGAHEFLHSLFDANVLYPAPIRDILMQLAVTDLFRAKSSLHRY
jgi:hypothetical protein